jgi:hypothetical protein
MNNERWIVKAFIDPPAWAVIDQDGLTVCEIPDRPGAKERADKIGAAPELLDALHALRVELSVRTMSAGFPSRPEQWRRRGFTAAFDSGYESGWRGRAFSDPYTSSAHSRAYIAGYEQGRAESQREIDRILREGVSK